MTAIPLRRQLTWTRILGWALAAILLVGILRRVPLGDLWTAFRHMDIGTLALLVLLNGVILWCFGGRGWVILRALGYRIPYRDQVAYRVAAFSVNYFTPGPQFGGEPLHTYLLARRHPIPWEVALNSVLMDRLLEWVVNLAFLLLGTGVLLGLDLLPAPASTSLLLGIGGVSLLPPGYLVALARGRRPLSALIGRWRSSGKNMLQALAQKVIWQETLAVRLWGEHPRAMLVALGITVGTWALLIGEYTLMLQALGVHLTVWRVVAVMTAARLAFLFPTPGGLGALETGQVFMLSAFGYDPATGLSVSMLIRARDILVGLIGMAIAGHLVKNSRRRPVPSP